MPIGCVSRDIVNAATGSVDLGNMAPLDGRNGRYAGRKLVFGESSRDTHGSRLSGPSPILSLQAVIRGQNVQANRPQTGARACHAGAGLWDRIR